jgi:hypothetical protein
VNAPTVAQPNGRAMTATTAGRGWAYLGAILGGGVSVAANIAHSYVRPEDALAG